MTQEDKKLLLTDLCARLPYKLWTHFEYESNLTTINEDKLLDFEDVETLKYNIQHPEAEGCAKMSFKPYLRPLTSMTDKEREEYRKFSYYGAAGIRNDDYSEMVGVPSFEKIDYLISHHFDYCGLIPKGLAIAVTEDNNPYKL